ncbi:hypothetical protein JCM10213_005695 [Rhodosporidiobolus nylandii]
MASTDHATPQRTINDLPVELKKRIVELVAEQDAVYEQWTDAVLKASMAGIPYQLRVAASRSHHFTEVDLDTHDATRLTAALTTLSRLPRLAKLTLRRSVLESAGHDAQTFIVYNDPQTIRTLIGTVVGGTSGQVEQLELHDFSLAQAGPLLRRCRNLRTLHLHLSPSAFDARATAFVSYLEKTTTLNDLRISSSANELDSPLPLDSLLPHLPPSLASLTRLTIRTSVFVASTIAFAVRFASLRSLTLISTAHFDEDEEPHVPPELEDEAFPHVERLEVVGYVEHVLVTVRSFKSQHFPALQHLTLELSDLDEDVARNTALFRTMTTNFPCLRSLRVHRGARLGAVESQDLTAACSEHGIAAYDCPALPVFPATAFFNTHVHDATCEDCEVQTASFRPFARTLADFLSSEVERAERDGDDASLVGLARPLRALELERLARIG